MTWLDRIPLWVLITVAVYMLLAPFIPMPHVVEKLLMLKEGSLTRPLDIVDLVMHLTPATLLGIRLIRKMR
jgi:hypothetical protein